MRHTFACCHDALVLKGLLRCLQTSQVTNAGNEVRMNPELQKIFCAVPLSFCHIFEAAIAFAYAASQNNPQDLPFSLRKS